MDNSATAAPAKPAPEQLAEVRQAKSAIGIKLVELRRRRYELNALLQTVHGELDKLNCELHTLNERELDLITPTRLKSSATSGSAKALGNRAKLNEVVRRLAGQLGISYDEAQRLLKNTTI